MLQPESCFYIIFFYIGMCVNAWFKPSWDTTFDYLLSKTTNQAIICCHYPQNLFSNLVMNISGQTTISEGQTAKIISIQVLFVRTMNKRKTQAFHMCWNSEFGVPARQQENIATSLSAEQEIELYRLLYSASTGSETEREKKAQWGLKRCDLFLTPRCVLYLPDKTCVKKRWVFKRDVIKVCASRRWIHSLSEKNPLCKMLRLVLWWFKTVLKWNVIIDSWVWNGTKWEGRKYKKQTVSVTLFGADTVIKVISVNDFSIYVQVCDEIQASWKAPVYFCSFVSDQWLLRYGGAAPLHHYHSSWASAPPSRGREQAINVRLKA